MKKALLTAAMVIFAGPVFAADPAQVPSRAAALGEEFVIYQAGLAYLQHCREFEIHRKMHPRYTKNAVELAKALAAEIAKDDPSFSAKQAMIALSSQEDELARGFNTFYAGGKNCQSDEAIAASAHVAAFEDASQKAFRKYLAGLKPRIVE
jgi:hypothetical protein